MESGPTAGQAISLDALSGLAPLLRVRPEVQYVCNFGAQWASDHALENDGWAPFHIVTEGCCTLHLKATSRSVPLKAGDVALLPHGSAHVVHGQNTLHDASGPFDIRNPSTSAILVKTNTDDEPEAQLVCGRLKFDHADQNLVLSALPDSIIVSADRGSSAPHIRCLIELIREELVGARPGAAAIASDLASALLLIVVRAYLEAERQPESILSLLNHPTAARAVTAMLKYPEKAWTLDELAVVSNASRASLARIFRQTAQISPLAFLAKARLELAKRKLQGSRASLAAVAAEVGYKSESAFSHAFHLRYGIRPGEARHRLRSDEK